MMNLILDGEKIMTGTKRELKAFASRNSWGYVNEDGKNIYVTKEVGCLWFNEIQEVCCETGIN